MKDKKKGLADIILTIDNLTDFAATYRVQDLEHDLQKKWAVERGVSVIGGAVYQLSKIDRSVSITNLRQMVGMRHIIIHDYDRLGAAQLVTVIQKHLPLLKQEAETILASLSI